MTVEAISKQLTALRVLWSIKNSKTPKKISFQKQDICRQFNDCWRNYDAIKGLNNTIINQELRKCTENCQIF